jgi:hypothetical protein
VRALVNEEAVDARFPFFVKYAGGDALCLYRDVRNEAWCIDNTGAGRASPPPPPPRTHTPPPPPPLLLLQEPTPSGA